MLPRVRNFCKHPLDTTPWMHVFSAVISQKQNSAFWRSYESAFVTSLIIIIQNPALLTQNWFTGAGISQPWIKCLFVPKSTTFYITWSKASKLVFLYSSFSTIILIKITYFINVRKLPIIMSELIYLICIQKCIFVWSKLRSFHRFVYKWNETQIDKKVHRYLNPYTDTNTE